MGPTLNNDELPYNPSNILVTKDHISTILKQYDIHTPIKNLNIYRMAFVNKSYCTRKNENFIDGNTLCPENCLPLQEESNERLEFLGDSILSITVADYLFNRYYTENEGFLTRMRTKLVNGKMLAWLSAKIGLPPYILISKQIEDNNGRQNSNILEDAFEAFIAAIYQDLGFEIARTWIINVIEYNLDFADLIQQNNNFKDSLLKHYQQSHGYIPKFYEMNVETINNNKIYTISIKDKSDNIISIGKGTNKKEAENDAAQKALKHIGI
jgi:ribonuclease-3